MCSVWPLTCFSVRVRIGCKIHAEQSKIDVGAEYIRLTLSQRSVAVSGHCSVHYVVLPISQLLVCWWPESLENLCLLLVPLIMGNNCTQTRTRTQNWKTLRAATVDTFGKKSASLTQFQMQFHSFA